MNSFTSSECNNLTVDHILRSIRRMPDRPTFFRVSKVMTQQYRFPPAGMPARMARAWRKRAENFRPLPYVLKDTTRNVIYIHPFQLELLQSAERLRFSGR